MPWILFSILAPAFWAASNVIDKHVLEKYFKKPIAALLIFGVVGLIISIIILSINFILPPKIILFLSILNGAIFVLPLLLYIFALNLEEASRVMPLFETYAIFVLLLSTIFLKELITNLNYLGIFLLILGAILISIKKGFRLRNKKAFLFALLTSAIFALNTVLQKYLLDFADYWTIFSYTRIGTFLALLPFFYFYFPELKRVAKKYGAKAILITSTSDILGTLGHLFLIMASSIGLISLISALTATQSLFVFLYTLILSLFFPKILKEELKGSTILTKLLAIALIITGVILVT